MSYIGFIVAETLLLEPDTDASYLNPESSLKSRADSLRARSFSDMPGYPLIIC